MKTQIDREIIELQRAVGRYTKMIEFIQTHGDKLPSTGTCCISIWSTSIQVYKCSRAAVIQTIKNFPGKWHKNYTESGTITYEHTTPEGIPIYLRDCPPPPHCKIIEEIITVPSQYVPEHKESRRRIVCK